MSPKDTLNTLVDEHFPGCKKPAQREVCPEKLKRDEKVRNSFFDPFVVTFIRDVNRCLFQVRARVP